MRQPDLFAPPRPSVAPPAPNLPNIRKSLTGRLRLLRDAVILPWSDYETGQQATRFPALARLLPPEEAEPMVEEFMGHLERLGYRRAA